MCPGVDSASKNEYQFNPGGKGGRCVRLTTYHLHVPMSRNLGTLTSWNSVGLFRSVMGQLYLYQYLAKVSGRVCPGEGVLDAYWKEDFVVPKSSLNISV
jgi:hypothetical protein